MAEEEVSYASVTIKSKKQPQSEGKNENETVYDEVKVNKEAKAVEDAEVKNQNESVQQTLEGLLPDKTAERCRRYQQLCCCFGTLCIMLVLSVIGVCVYFTTIYESTSNDLAQLISTQKEKIQNLTELNHKLISDNANLTAASMALKNNITTLTAENRNLTSLNEELKEQKKNLTEIIQNMTETWNELNVSRAQWSVHAYCPKNNGARSCRPCQDGWIYQISSCYAYVDHQSPNQRTWENALEDCKGKKSDLTVVSDQAEKDYVNSISPAANDINGYWIGLRAVEGKWKWTDGSDLTDQSWIQQQTATDGYCVTSRNGQGWNTVRCSDKNAWICEKKALSV